MISCFSDIFSSMNDMEIEKIEVEMWFSFVSRTFTWHWASAVFGTNAPQIHNESETKESGGIWQVSLQTEFQLIVQENISSSHL